MAKVVFDDGVSFVLIGSGDPTVNGVTPPTTCTEGCYTDIATVGIQPVYIWRNGNSTWAHKS